MTLRARGPGAESKGPSGQRLRSVSSGDGEDGAAGRSGFQACRALSRDTGVRGTQIDSSTGAESAPPPEFDGGQSEDWRLHRLGLGRSCRSRRMGEKAWTRCLAESGGVGAAWGPGPQLERGCLTVH